MSKLKRIIFSSLQSAFWHRSGLRCQTILSLLGLAMLMPVLTACSLTFPIFGSSKGDEPLAADTTASLALSAPQQALTPAALLARDLGPEDMRRALGAMALALDPQGNGTAVNWNNPESGLRGVFTPVGGPFLHDDQICRAFLSTSQLQSGAAAYQGTACRPSGGEWALRELMPWKKPL